MNGEFTRFRSIMGFEKFPKYLDWIRFNFPGLEPHHILGSMGAKKFTDALVMPLEHNHHINEVTPNIAKYFNHFLMPSVNLFTEYCREVNIKFEKTFDPYKLNTQFQIIADNK